MNILITGGSCLLGKYLIDTAPEQHRVSATWYTNYVDLGVPMLQMDVSNQSQVAYVFGRIKPDVVVHCAAIGSVDWVEQHYPEAAQCIVNGTEHVIAACEDYKAQLIYTSTNAVFGGDAPPYTETSERHPINAYGKLRKQAEDLVMDSSHWLILRLFLLYGWPPQGARSNWAEMIKEDLENKQSLFMIDDVYWQPTYAGDVAQALWALLKRGNDNEVYHVAGVDRVTLYEFGQAVATTWGLNGDLIEPVGGNVFSGIAPRPKDASYALGKLHDVGIKPSGVLAGLEAMKQEDLW